MSGTSRQGNSSIPAERPPVRSTPAQILRQVAVIIVVMAIWSALLVGYLGLTRTGQKPGAASPQPTGMVVAPAAAESPTPPAQTAAEVAKVSFANDVLPVLKNRCERCHGSQRTEAGLDLSSYAGVMAASARGPVVIPGSAATSRLVEVIVSGRMPSGGPKLPDTEIQTIRGWVDAGAPDN
jgi:uncharacterized membrane protein